MDLLDPMAEIAQLLGLVAEDAGNVAGPYDPVGAGIPVVQNLSAGANGGFIASLPLGEFLVGLPALGNVARDSANDRRSAVGVEADASLVRDPGHRKSVASGKRVPVPLDPGGRRHIKKTTQYTTSQSVLSIELVSQ